MFRAAWGRQSACCADPCVKAVIALAPALPVRAFAPASLAASGLPVTVMFGGAGQAAPADLCAGWLHDRLPGYSLHPLGRDIGHDGLLREAMEDGRRLEPGICVDAPSVNRRAVHGQAVEIALAVLREPLLP